MLLNIGLWVGVRASHYQVNCPGKFGLGDAYVVFGHTHRAGPLPGDREQEWSGRAGARLVNAGSWTYSEIFVTAKPGESLHDAVNREVKAVRQAVGIVDASTLGKIDLKGRDVPTLLNWVYTNS